MRRDKTIGEAFVVGLAGTVTGIAVSENTTVTFIIKKTIIYFLWVN